MDRIMGELYYPVFQRQTALGIMASCLIALVLLDLSLYRISAHPDARTYYVAPGGNDLAAGDQAHPWQHIQRAVNSAKAGDTVYVRNGTYHERVVHQNSGTPGNPIVFAVYLGEMVTLDGTGIDVPQDSGLWDFNGQSYLTLSGFRVINSNYAGIYADGSNYLTIQHNYTYNSASSGIGVWNSNNIIIDHNEVAMSGSNGYQESITVANTGYFDVHNNLVYNGAGYEKEGICLKDGSHDGKAYQNTVRNTLAASFYVDAEARHTYNIDVYQNTVYAGGGDGISLATEAGGLLENIRVYNNLTFNNTYVGLLISVCCQGVATHPIHNVQFINNTIYSNGTSWGGGISIDSPDIQNVIIRNNLISQNLSFQMEVSSGVPAAQLTIDHNLIDGFRNSEGEVRGNSYSEGNPKFANAAGNNFHISAGSPAIDHGSAVNAPGTDFDGNIRPQGSGYDIGAYEFVLAAGRWYLPLLFH